MFILLARAPQIGWRQLAPLLLPAGLILLGFTFLNGYVSSDSGTVIIGLMAVITTATRQAPAKPRRFIIPALVMVAITWIIPVHTFLFFAIAFSLFFWMELQLASIHFLGVAALILASPAFGYAVAAFSFPIRLQLTKWVGAIFGTVSTGITTKGNAIYYKGHEFSVDPACMGLHMFSISLLMGIILLGLVQMKTGRRMSSKKAVLYLCCLVVANLIANVLRIILLVQFSIPPGATMHDVVGLACLLLYVCLPACYLARRFISIGVTQTKVVTNKPTGPSPVLQGLLLTALLAVALKVTFADTYLKFKDKEKLRIGGYTSSLYAPGIVKLENKQALVYIKFIRGFYDTEHNPTICWRGSGYEFKEISKQQVAGGNVYKATLCNGNEKLYTAWWYSNGTSNTVSQWRWRWDMLKGSAGYAVVNVTAANEASLSSGIESVLQPQKLLPLFRQ